MWFSRSSSTLPFLLGLLLSVGENEARSETRALGEGERDRERGVTLPIPEGLGPGGNRLLLFRASDRVDQTGETVTCMTTGGRGAGERLGGGGVRR